MIKASVAKQVQLYQEEVLIQARPEIARICLTSPYYVRQALVLNLTWVREGYQRFFSTASYICNHCGQLWDRDTMKCVSCPHTPSIHRAWCAARCWFIHSGHLVWPCQSSYTQCPGPHCLFPLAVLLLLGPTTWRTTFLSSNGRLHIELTTWVP